MALLTEKPNGAYSLISDVNQMSGRCQSSDSQLTDKCQHSLGKDSLGKDSLGKGSVVEETASATDVENSRNQLKLLGGTIGKGVVYLTDAQMDNLIDRLGLDGFNRTVGRLADYIIAKNAHINNHYEMILKWYEQDSMT
jgi:hypothetical protein